jgi:probable phosphomutase (TIGR03848 family)
MAVRGRTLDAVTTVLLVRHGRTGANTDGILAGWTPGVSLDGSGQAQAATLARRLAAVPLAVVVTSPLQRCRETADAMVAVAGPEGVDRPQPVVEERLGECRYGDWTGRRLKDLVKDPLWRVVQVHPSAVTFPGEAGESMLAMQHRAVSAIRDHDARIGAQHGADSAWVAVSHGDVIKAILADALGMHLDGFQRLVIDPCSVSAIRYAALRPFVLRINDTGGDLTGLALTGNPAAHRPRTRTQTRSHRNDHFADSDAAVGGGAGPPAALTAPDAGSGGHRASRTTTP